MKLVEVLENQILKCETNGGNHFNLTEYGLPELVNHIQCYSEKSYSFSEVIYSEETIKLLKLFIESMTSDEITFNETYED